MNEIYYHFYRNFLIDEFKTNEERYDFVKSALLGTTLDEFRYACNFLTMFEENTSAGLFQGETHRVSDLKKIANDRIEAILGPVKLAYIGVVQKYGYPNSLENMYKLFSFKYTTGDEKAFTKDIKRLVICLFTALAIYNNMQKGIIKSAEDYSRAIQNSEDIIYNFHKRTRKMVSMGTFLENFWFMDYSKAYESTMFILSVIQEYQGME